PRGRGNQNRAGTRGRSAARSFRRSHGARSGSEEEGRHPEGQAGCEEEACAAAESPEEKGRYEEEIHAAAESPGEIQSQTSQKGIPVQQKEKMTPRLICLLAL